VIRELEIRELERKKEKGRLFALKAPVNSGQAFFALGRLLSLKFTAPLVDANFTPIYL